MKTRQARCQVQFCIQQHAINNEPHEQRLDHLQSGAHEGDNQQRADRVTMRPQPAQVLAQILASLAPALAGNGNGTERAVNPNDPTTWGKVGRNEPCPCGSGKKYKHCHGRFG